MFFGTHAGASNGTAAAAAAVVATAAAEQQQQVQQQGRPKHTLCTNILLDMRRGDVSTIFSYGLSSPGGPRCCCDSCAKKGLPCCHRLSRLRRHHRRRCCFCCAAAAAAAVLLLSCCCAAALVTYGYLFSVFLKKYAVLRDASRSFLFSIRDYLYFLVI